MRTALSLMLLGACLLTGCGGMNRAVTVMPQTMDDLARQSEGFRAPVQ